MRKTLCVLLVSLAIAAFSFSAYAQQKADEGGGGRVIHGSSADFVVGATSEDLNLPRYKAFDEFAVAHPEIVAQLTKKPRLIDSDQFLHEHSELSQFLDQHPDVKADFSAHPGNYVGLGAGGGSEDSD